MEAAQEASAEQALVQLRQSRLKVLPIVNAAGELASDPMLLSVSSHL